MSKDEEIPEIKSEAEAKAINEKEGLKWSREKKNWVLLDKRKMKLREYVRVVAAELPPLLWHDTSKRIDHVEMLKAYYCTEGGLDGIRKYVSLVNRLVNDLLQEKAAQIAAEQDAKEENPEKDV